MPLSTDFKPYINGHQYSFCDIGITIAGQPVSGVTEISYKSERDMENYYAGGSEPHGYVFGERKYEASISMTKKLCDALKKSSKTGKLEDISAFDLPVVFLDEDGAFTRDTLKNLKFKGADQAYKKGDKGLEVKCACLISGIETTFG
jgi:hypothetical protein